MSWPLRLGKGPRPAVASGIDGRSRAERNKELDGGPQHQYLPTPKRKQSPRILCVDSHTASAIRTTPRECIPCRVSASNTKVAGKETAVITTGGPCAEASPTVAACRTAPVHPAARRSGRPAPATGRCRRWACSSGACAGWGASRGAAVGAGGAGSAAPRGTRLGWGRRRRSRFLASARERSGRPKFQVSVARERDAAASRDDVRARPSGRNPTRDRHTKAGLVGSVPESSSCLRSSLLAVGASAS